jgi:hypothetical protein
VDPLSLAWSDASGAAHPAATAGVVPLELTDAGAGKSVGLESVVRAQGGSLPGDSQSAVHLQSAALCTPDAVRSAAQSFAGQEAQAEQAQLAVVEQALAVLPTESRWAEPQM